MLILMNKNMRIKTIVQNIIFLLNLDKYECACPYFPQHLYLQEVNLKKNIAQVQKKGGYQHVLIKKKKKKAALAGGAQ